MKKKNLREEILCLSFSGDEEFKAEHYDEMIVHSYLAIKHV